MQLWSDDKRINDSLYPWISKSPLEKRIADSAVRVARLEKSGELVGAVNVRNELRARVV